MNIRPIVLIIFSATQVAILSVILYGFGNIKDNIEERNYTGIIEQTEQVAASKELTSPLEKEENIAKTVAKEPAKECSFAPKEFVNGSLDIPDLLPDLTWDMVGELTYEDAIYYHTNLEKDNQVVSLTGNMWSAELQYSQTWDQDFNNFFKYYNKELAEKGWNWAVNAHNIEVRTITGNGARGGSAGFIKLNNGKFRTVILTHSTAYTGDMHDENAEPISTIFEVFVSDIYSLKEVAPIYNPSSPLGVVHGIITPKIQEDMNLPVDYGAWVVSQIPSESAIMPNSPAESAGIKDRDIILELNGQKINSENTLIKLLDKHCPNDSITLKILSDEEEREVTAVLSEF